MADWVRVGQSNALRVGAGVRVDIEDRAIALRRTNDGSVRGIDDACLHSAGPLSEGNTCGDEVTCPWHRWRYSLTTGQRLDRPGALTRVYHAEDRDGWIWLDLDPANTKET